MSMRISAVHGLLLPDDALAKRIFHLEQLVALAFEHLVDGHAGPQGECPAT